MAAETIGNLARVRDALYRKSPIPVGADNPVSEWCMIIVRPNMEQEARDALRRRGVGAYWPNYEKLEVVKSRLTEDGRSVRRLRLASVVSGIIFSPATLNNVFWNGIDFAPGVINIARRSSRDLVILTDTDIVLIHKIEEGLNKPPVEKIIHNFKVGDKVRLVGAQGDRWPPGVIIKVARNGRITIEIDAMGRKVKFNDLLPHQIERT